MVRGGYELYPGLPLHSVLMATYAVLSEGRDAEQQGKLDDQLGFNEEQDEEQDEVEDRSMRSHDPKAQALLQQYGDIQAVA